MPPASSSPEPFFDRLARHAADRPSSPALGFLRRGLPDDVLSWAELDVAVLVFSGLEAHGGESCRPPSPAAGPFFLQFSSGMMQEENVARFAGALRARLASLRSCEPGGGPAGEVGRAPALR